ncbi:MAG: CC/Se motif family (seleno)protein [Caulobacteraceae bacterium]
MKVKITEEAQQYIMENGHTVTVHLGTVSGCCGGAAPMPQIQLGAPGDLSSYVQNTIGDINLFIDKQIDAEKQLIILLGKLLWLKKLSVEII